MAKLFFTLLIASIVFGTKAQNVGVGTTTPVTSAQLDVTSTNKGFLPPRMTAAQRSAIIDPVPGLVVYCTDCDELQVFNGVIWKNISGTAATLPNNTTIPTVTICNQIWMGINLSVSKFRDSSTIPHVTDPAIWASTTLPAWCWYNNDSANYWQYGRLYNWYAVNDIRNLAPVGWHIPSNAELTILSDCLGGNVAAGGAGGKIKEAGTAHWNSPNTSANNSSGFTGLPGNARSVAGVFAAPFGNFGNWWSSTPYDADLVWYRFCTSTSGTFAQGATYKANGFSVRCVKD